MGQSSSYRIGKGLNVACALLMLSACAGRQAQPVQVVRATDQQLSCTQVMVEIESNNVQIASLLGEEDDKRAQNIVAGSVGLILFFPALFLMDFQDAAGDERKALQARQQYLQQTAAERCA